MKPSSKTPPKKPTKSAEQLAEEPIEGLFSGEASRKRNLELAQTYFQPQMQILELGCGSGVNTILYAPYVKQILACDTSEIMLKLAEKQADKAQIQNIRFEQNTIETLELSEASFDAIVATKILNSLSDPKAALKKIYNALKPGGFFISSTVCLPDEAKQLPDGAKKFHMSFSDKIGGVSLEKLFSHRGSVPSAITLFSAEGLVKYLTDANFAIDYQEIYNKISDKKQTQFIVAKKPAQ